VMSPRTLTVPRILTIATNLSLSDPFFIKIELSYFS
jgi:hypothetical protein